MVLNGFFRGEAERLAAIWLALATCLQMKRTALLASITTDIFTCKHSLRFLWILSILRGKLSFCCLIWEQSVVKSLAQGPGQKYPFSSGIWTSNLLVNSSCLPLKSTNLKRFYFFSSQVILDHFFWCICHEMFSECYFFCACKGFLPEVHQQVFASFIHVNVKWTHNQQTWVQDAATKAMKAKLNNEHLSDSFGKALQAT